MLCILFFHIFIMTTEVNPITDWTVATDGTTTPVNPVVEQEIIQPPIQQPSVEGWFEHVWEDHPANSDSDISLNDLWEPHEELDFNLWDVHDENLDEHTDDLFGGDEENLNKVEPEIETNLEDAPVADVSSEADVTPVEDVTSEVKLVTPEVEPVVEEQEQVMDVLEEPSQEELHDDESLLDIFSGLWSIMTNIYYISSMEEGDDVEVIGSDNDTVRVVYNFVLNDNRLSIERDETTIETGDEKNSELAFVKDGDDIKVYMDDTLLFDGDRDLQDDAKRKQQVIDKMNKMKFLLEEHVKKLEKESDKKWLLDTFKSF